MKKILAIGAFERDNFGDLLFLRTLRDYFSDKNFEITPASIIFSDMRQINGEIIYPYKLLLEKYKWDVVWVVGGEIGGVDIDSALAMDAIDKNGQIYNSLSKPHQISYRNILNVPDDTSAPAYLPDLSIYDKNRDATLVVNSIGISNAPINPIIFKKTIKTLSKSVLSVREKESAAFCEDNGINTMISPDIVSLISLFHPVPNKKIKPAYIVAQINQQLLKSSNIKELASIFCAIGDELNSKIILLKAGVTFGHDDENLYQKIIHEYKALESKQTIEIFQKRDPILISELIAGSKLCIATSLHARIVSESYDVPRISLTNRKVTNYVSSWENDSVYPHDVPIKNLLDVVKSLKKFIDAPISGNEKLGKIAQKNLDTICSIIGKTPEVKDQLFNGDDKEILLEYIAAQKPSVDKAFHVANNEMTRLKNEVQNLTEEFQACKIAVQNVQNSKAYKIGRATTYPYRTLRKIMENDKDEKK